MNARPDEIRPLLDESVHFWCNKSVNQAEAELESTFPRGAPEAPPSPPSTCTRPPIVYQTGIYWILLQAAQDRTTDWYLLGRHRIRLEIVHETGLYKFEHD
jgi:hypothetical protein